MPSAVTKFSDSPIRFVDEAFERMVIRDGKRIEDVLKHISAVCKTELIDGGMTEKLPVLTKANLCTLENGTLIRYRCMIQDMRQPEYFQSSYSTLDGSKSMADRVHCSLWKEHLEIPDGHEFQDTDDDPKRQTLERHVLVGSWIPAETPWVRGYYNGTSVETVRPMEQSSPSGQCVLKIYQGGDQLKLNETIEVIGVYYTTSAMDEEETSGNAARTPNALPCIHAFHYEKLQHYHPGPSMPEIASRSREENARAYLLRILRADIPAFRAILVEAISKDLFDGDELAAEYLVCHLMSSVYARDVASAVGHFSLNIYNVREKDWADIKLRPYLENLLTQVSYLPLSLQLLNTTALVPKKCYDTDRLIGGRLQLPKGTELVLDETKLEAGRLDTQGVANMAALRTMIKFQKLDYDFGYNSVEFSTDIRALILSEGQSILSSDFALPLSARTGDINREGSNRSMSAMADEEFVKAARIFFSLAPILSFTIDEQMQKKIQEDFVEMRRTSNGQVTADNLHRLLTVARMLSLSFGDSRLRGEIWEKAKTMETERANRSTKK